MYISDRTSTGGAPQSTTYGHALVADYAAHEILPLVPSSSSGQKLNSLEAHDAFFTFARLPEYQRKNTFQIIQAWNQLDSVKHVPDSTARRWIKTWNAAHPEEPIGVQLIIGRRKKQWHGEFFEFALQPESEGLTISHILAKWNRRYREKALPITMVEHWVRDWNSANSPQHIGRKKLNGETTRLYSKAFFEFSRLTQHQAMKVPQVVAAWNHHHPDKLLRLSMVQNWRSNWKREDADDWRGPKNLKNVEVDFESIVHPHQPKDGRYVQDPLTGERKTWKNVIRNLEEFESWKNTLKINPEFWMGRNLSEQGWLDLWSASKPHLL